MDKTPNLRTMKITTSSGKPVSQTQKLKGEASNSLSGKNDTTEYSTSGGAKMGKLGGLPSHT